MPTDQTAREILATIRNQAPALVEAAEAERKAGDAQHLVEAELLAEAIDALKPVLQHLVSQRTWTGCSGAPLEMEAFVLQTKPPPANCKLGEVLVLDVFGVLSIVEEDEEHHAVLDPDVTARDAVQEFSVFIALEAVAKALGKQIVGRTNGATWMTARRERVNRALVCMRSPK